MSYAEQAELIHNGAWRERVDACTREQAAIFADDARPEFRDLAYAVIHEPLGSAVQAVAAQAATAPGMNGESTDGDLLAAVQNVWPKVGVTYVDPGETP